MIDVVFVGGTLHTQTRQVDDDLPELVTDTAEVYVRIMVRDDGVRVYRYSPSRTRS